MIMYKLIKKYPGLPGNWEVGMILCKRSENTYGPCNSRYELFLLSKSLITDNPDYFFESGIGISSNISYPVLTYWVNLFDNKCSFFTGSSPKIITEEGDALYGNDRCYFIDNTVTTYSLNLLDYVSSNTIPLGKYFSKKSNAEKYLCELVAKKEKLFIGDILNTDKLNVWCEVNDVYAKPGASYFKSLYKNNFSRTWEVVNFKYMLDSVVAVIGPIGCSNTYNDVNIKITGYNEFNYNKNNFVIDQWYTYEDACVCYQGNRSYGFNFKKKWVTMFNTSFDSTHYQNWKIASEYQVKELLINKVTNDYPSGTKLKSAVSDTAVVSTGNACNISIHKINIKCFHSYYEFIRVYDNGVWAEIIKLSLGDEIVKLEGNNVSTCKWSVTFEDWSIWFKNIKWFYANINKGVIELTLLDVDGITSYVTESVVNEFTSIGCISDITWEQMNTVNNAVLKLTSGE